jgi:hypothetical protein
MTAERSLRRSGVVITVAYVDRFSALDVAAKRFQARSWGVQVQHGIEFDILVAVHNCETRSLRRTQVEYFNFGAGKWQEIE